MIKTALLSGVSLVAFAAFQRPVVQVRDVPNAPTITVLAWDAGTPDYGLRTRINREGEDIGDVRHGEHRLYLSSGFANAHGDFATAVTQDNKFLRRVSPAQDPDACKFGECTPANTIGLGVSDEWLRKHPDSLVVTFRPHTGQNWSIRLDGSIIKAYLSTIDSVEASLKKK